MHDTPDTPDNPASPADRLAAFESVGERLWPYVRYFCMSGACIDAIDAVVCLGSLLGKDQDSNGQATVAQAQQVRDLTVEHVAGWLEGAAFVQSKVGSRLAGELATELRRISQESE